MSRSNQMTKKFFILFGTLFFLVPSMCFAAVEVLTTKSVFNLSADQRAQLSSINTQMQVIADNAAFNAVVKNPGPFASVAEKATFNSRAEGLDKIARDKGYRSAGHMIRDGGLAQEPAGFGGLDYKTTPDKLKDVGKAAADNALAPNHLYGGQGEFDPGHRGYSPEVEKLHNEAYEVVYGEGEFIDDNGVRRELTEQEKEARKAERAQQMGTPEGRRILDLARKADAGAIKPPVGGGTTDPNVGGDPFGGGAGSGGADPAAPVAPPEFDTTEINAAICDIFDLMEGGLGALLSVAAGVGALFAMAFGAYKAGYGLIVVAAAGFVVRSFVAIFFGTFDCAV